MSTFEDAENDAVLLRAWSDERSEPAFRRLVDRHLPAVWSAARRVVNGDAALAEDIAQEVFIHLAQRAGKLVDGTVLGGWLHRHACFTAAKAIRASARRRAREITAAAMTTEPDNPWPDIAPHLDAALESLPAGDRDALVLRFFEKRNFRSIGEALGISEDAARIKSGRALEKLRGILGKRTAALTIAALSAALGDHAVAAPPAGMSAQITAASFAKAGTGAALTGLALLAHRLRRLKAPLAAATALLLAGGSLWHWQTRFAETGRKTRAAMTASGAVAARPAAKEPGAVDVVVHFLIVPDDKAMAILNKRWNGDGDTALLADLLKQAGSGAGGVVMAQRLAKTCRSGSRVKLGRTKPLTYWTEWSVNEDGTVKGRDSTERGIGSTAEMELTINDDGATCDLNLAFEHHFAEPEIQRWPVSLTNPDAPELSAVHLPEFRTARTNAQVLMAMGEARMAAASQLPRANGPVAGPTAGYLFTFVSLPPITVPSVAAHPEGVKEISVRIVTFEKAGAATALDAVRPEGDENLFDTLAANATDGSARITGDQTVNIRSGQRSKVEALREFPYPTEYDTDLTKARSLPNQFTFRYTGQTFEAEATVGELGSLGFPGYLLDLNLAPEVVAMAFLNPWPVPHFRGAGKMGRVTQPVFTAHKLTTQVLTTTGLNMLLAVAPAPQTVLTEDAETTWRYTFLRVGLKSENPADPAKARDYLPLQRRLHALTIRLPRDAAAVLMAHRNGNNTALFDELAARVSAGTASLANHTSILCRNGQRSKVESIAEFPTPRRFQDLLPKAWTFLNHGPVMEVDADGGFSGKRHPISGGWLVSWEMPTNPEMIAYHPDADRPALHVASFENITRQITAGMTIPPSGILCAGAISTSPATEDETAPNGTTDICFFIQSPPPDKPETDAKPQVFLQALVLSVPGLEGPSLAGRGGKPAASGGVASTLLQRMERGEIHCAAQAAVVVREGMKSVIRCTRQVQQPSEFEPAESSPELEIPTSWESSFCGVEIEASVIGGHSGLTLNGHYSWDSAPVLPFGEPGAAVPEMKARRCQERIELKNITMPPGKPVIGDVRASKAREGTREHGRWHVLVIIAGEAE